MTTSPSDQSKYFTHHKNGVPMSATQPSRRTLVKGAAWSVPLVAVGSQAPAVAASPCNIIVTADCTASGLSFSYSVTGPRPGTLSFTLAVSVPAGQGQGNDGTWTGGPGITLVGNTATVDSETATSGVLLNVTRSANSGARVYTVSFTGTTECTVSSASGRFDGSTCTAPATSDGARTLTSDEATEAPAPDAPADTPQQHADAGTGPSTGEPLGETQSGADAETQSVTDGQIQSGTDEEATTAGP